MSSPPKGWQEVAKDEANCANERLEQAMNICRMAKEQYTAEPTRVNRINLKAAVRLVKETKAQAEEWSV